MKQSSDAGAGDAGSDGSDGAPNPRAPVIDSVVLPQSASIDPSTATAEISGAVSFHDDFSTVTTVTIVVHAPSGASAYAYPIQGLSPQSIQLEIKQAGAIEVDLSITDQAGLSSMPYAQIINVTQ